jgi:hypothetical protein
LSKSTRKSAQLKNLDRNRGLNDSRNTSRFVTTPMPKNCNSRPHGSILLATGT